MIKEYRNIFVNKSIGQEYWSMGNVEDFKNIRGRQET